MEQSRVVGHPLDRAGLHGVSSRLPTCCHSQSLRQVTLKVYTVWLPLSCQLLHPCTCRAGLRPPPPCSRCPFCPAPGTEWSAIAGVLIWSPGLGTPGRWGQAFSQHLQHPVSPIQCSLSPPSPFSQSQVAEPPSEEDSLQTGYSCSNLSHRGGREGPRGHHYMSPECWPPMSLRAVLPGCSSLCHSKTLKPQCSFAKVTSHLSV